LEIEEMKSTLKKKTGFFSIAGIGGLIALFFIGTTDRSQERTRIKQKYEAVRVGASLPETENVLGIPPGVLVISSEKGMDIERLEAEFSRDVRFDKFLTKYYAANNYAIMIHYEHLSRDKELVVGKEFLAIKRDSWCPKLTKLAQRQFSKMHLGVSTCPPVCSLSEERVSKLIKAKRRAVSITPSESRRITRSRRAHPVRHGGRRSADERPNIGELGGGDGDSGWQCFFGLDGCLFQSKIN
jgi:hypothetical protein